MGAASRAPATELAARVAMAMAARNERRRTIGGFLSGGDKQALGRWTRSRAFAVRRVDRDDDEAGYEPEVLEERVQRHETVVPGQVPEVICGQHGDGSKDAQASGPKPDQPPEHHEGR